MNLNSLIDGLAQRESGPDVEVVDLSSDSREVGPGWAFLALKGEQADGAAFVPQALAKGACAVISETPVAVPDAIATCTFLAEPRLRMAEMARRLHGTPDEHLALIGVTGTNGKTTTTTLIRQLLRGAGIGCGLVGTVLNAAGDREEEAVRTTPESPAFYRWLRRSIEAGDAASAVEVSSHALCLGRVHGALFKVGLFTNLTQDHLDYHGTLEAYFEAKASLRHQCERFLVNGDDAYGRRLLEGGRCWSYAIDAEAEYRATDLVLGPTGTRFKLRSLQGDFSVESPLLGRFNAYNLLAALAASAEAGFDLNALVPAVPQVTGAPGRLERVDCGQPFGVMVDYAHTPDALDKLLTEGRRLLSPGGRLHVLFGCGGDRDRTKRPLMAAAVAAGADVLWHTSDNPRTEDPERILDDAAPGIPEALRGDATRYHRNWDRRASVAQALADCRPGDLLLLAGKGHEPYQEIHGVKHPYSDRAAVEAALGQSPRGNR
jgi:UDP-N-acetylmuramoyl-L-alanyl-D-glutamate--2,6-diaminopimelate ligase